MAGLESVKIDTVNANVIQIGKDILRPSLVMNNTKLVRDYKVQDTDSYLEINRTNLVNGEYQAIQNLSEDTWKRYFIKGYIPTSYYESVPMIYTDYNTDRFYHVDDNIAKVNDIISNDGSAGIVTSITPVELSVKTYKSQIAVSLVKQNGSTRFINPLSTSCKLPRFTLYDEDGNVIEPLSVEPVLTVGNGANQGVVNSEDVDKFSSLFSSEASELDVYRDFLGIFDITTNVKIHEITFDEVFEGDTVGFYEGYANVFDWRSFTVNSSEHKFKVNKNIFDEGGTVSRYLYKLSSDIFDGEYSTYNTARKHGSKLEVKLGIDGEYQLQTFSNINVQGNDIVVYFDPVIRIDERRIFFRFGVDDDRIDSSFYNIDVEFYYSTLEDPSSIRTLFSDNLFSESSVVAVEGTNLYSFDDTVIVEDGELSLDKYSEWVVE